MEVESCWFGDQSSLVTLSPIVCSTVQMVGSQRWYSSTEITLVLQLWNVMKFRKFCFCVLKNPNKHFLTNINHLKTRVIKCALSADFTVKLMCLVPPQVGNGHSCLRRWRIAAMSWRIYPEELLMCSGWAASPRQEQDLSVMLQHLLLWLLILKASTILPNIMLHVCCCICVISVINFSHFHSCVWDQTL